MTITHAIMLLGIVVAAVVALSVGHLQRKQMRQIELYKRDPSVGLVPPPTFVTRFVKSKWDSILGYGGPGFGLAIELFNHAPLTRGSVFLISLSVAFLLANFIMSIVFRLAERTTTLIEDLRQAQFRHLGLTEDTVSVLRRVAERLPEGTDGT